MSRIGLDEDVPTPVAPPHPVTPGILTQSQIDYSGAGSWNSGDAACRAYTADACRIMGIVDTSYWANGMATIALRESASNSAAWQVNTTDLNAVGPVQTDGAPLQSSRGGWQCVPWFANGGVGTFARYHQAGTSTQVYHPVSNVAASMNYIMDVYNVNRDGSNLAAQVQQADPNRPARGYATLNSGERTSQWVADQIAWNERQGS